MADIIIGQKQVQVKVLLNMGIIEMIALCVAFIFIRIKQYGLLFPLTDSFRNRPCHLIKCIRCQYVIMIHQSTVITCGIGKRLIGIL